MTEDPPHLVPVKSPAEPIETVALRHWHGLPFLWQEELRAHRAYAASLGCADLGDNAESLQMWLERVQAGRCPIIGTGCMKPAYGRFCALHAPRARSAGL